MPDNPANKRAIRDAIAEALDDDDRDVAGGVSTETIAARAGLCQSTVGDHLAEMHDHDAIAKVWGLATTNSRPRPSWLPCDHPDAPDTTPQREIQ